jgi:hypothetical protein
VIAQVTYLPDSTEESSDPGGSHNTTTVLVEKVSVVGLQTSEPMMAQIGEKTVRTLKRITTSLTIQETVAASLETQNNQVTVVVQRQLQTLTHR